MKNQIKYTTVKSTKQLILYIWLLSILFYFGIFFVKYFGLDSLMKVRKDFVLKASLSLGGFLMPSIQMIMYSIISDNKSINKEISKQKSRILVTMTVFFHVMMITTFAYGIISLGFDERANGEGVLNNTTAILLIGGFFSFLGAIPINYLFKD